MPLFTCPRCGLFVHVVFRSEKPLTFLEPTAVQVATMINYAHRSADCIQ